jgi:hypothetical protein
MGYGKTTRYLSIFEFGTEHVGKPTIQWLIINVSCENGEATSEKKTVNIRIPQGRKRTHTHAHTRAQFQRFQGQQSNDHYSVHG